MEMDNFLNFLVPVGILFAVFLLPALLGAGKRNQQRQQTQNRPLERPAADWREQPELRAGDIPLYFDMPLEQAGGDRPAPKKKKKKKSVPVIPGQGVPATEVPAMQNTVPRQLRKGSFPAFSDNPVVNGIVWAEILTRGGTKRKLP